ncbi:hypothetical protein, conserved [Leishmania tarentolae]|uniref:Uncharacterized protein n=1 Tax=Leishmania tarentolae TaxID=5689 RepID=A0A640KD90_LEITA|nr:hypothetical protein, conserved [Leishmania tarentolae]
MLLKEYRKGSENLLTKNFSRGGEWKIENKGKAPKGSYALATTSNTHGDVSVDVEGMTQSGAYHGKLTFASKDFSDVKVTVCAEDFRNHRVEAIIGHKGQSLRNMSVEVSHQTVKPIAGGYLSVNDKVTAKAMELALSMAAGKGVHIGCGTKYDLKSQAIDWTAACRLEATNGLVVTAHTNRLLSFTADVVSKAPLHPKFQPCVAATVTMNPKSMTWDGSMALEWGCQMMLGNTAKVRISKNLDWVASYVAKLRDDWTLVVSIDQTMKAGVTLTRS